MALLVWHKIGGEMCGVTGIRSSRQQGKTYVYVYTFMHCFAV